eukprot:6819072-Ditylum_brightwellii.AAC.1
MHSSPTQDAVFHPTTANCTSNNRQFRNNCQRVLYHSTVITSISMRTNPKQQKTPFLPHHHSRINNRNSPQPPKPQF